MGNNGIHPAGNPVVAWMVSLQQTLWMDREGKIKCKKKKNKLIN